MSAPQVMYRETISRPYNCEGTYARVSLSGPGHFAHVVINLEPAERGAGFEFKSKMVGGVVPDEYIPGARKGLEVGMGAGVVAG